MLQKEYGGQEYYYLRVSLLLEILIQETNSTS